MDQSPDPIEQEFPDLYPSCAVTRAMAKKARLTENQSDVDITDSFIGQLSFKNEITKSLSHNLPEHQADSNDYTSVSDHSPPSLVEDRDIRSRSQLSKEQHKDPEISYNLNMFLFKNWLNQHIHVSESIYTVIKDPYKITLKSTV